MSETLRQYIALHGLDEALVLNELQNHGVISDNAVGVADVGNGGVALAWLEKRDVRALRAREWGEEGGVSESQTTNPPQISTKLAL